MPLFLGKSVSRKSQKAGKKKKKRKTEIFIFKNDPRCVTRKKKKKVLQLGDVQKEGGLRDDRKEAHQ